MAAAAPSELARGYLAGHLPVVRVVRCCVRIACCATQLVVKADNAPLRALAVDLRLGWPEEVLRHFRDSALLWLVAQQDVPCFVEGSVLSVALGQDGCLLALRREGSVVISLRDVVLDANVGRGESGWVFVLSLDLHMASWDRMLLQAASLQLLVRVQTSLLPGSVLLEG